VLGENGFVGEVHGGMDTFWLTYFHLFKEVQKPIGKKQWLLRNHP
jgi:hypothetical protein